MPLILPNSLILGAPKSGTTWLYENLKGHPQIAMPRKEIHYFSNNKHQGLDWYSQHFADVYEQQNVIMEVAVNYLYHYDYRGPIYPYNPRVAEDIRETLNNPKLIVILRDPVERAFSDYIHFMQASLKYGHIYRGNPRSPKVNEYKDLALTHPAKRENPDFASQLESFYVPDNLVSTLISYPFLINRGLYDIYIQHYLSLFPREQFLFLDYAWIKQDAQAVIYRICDFLGINHWYDEEILNRSSNTAEDRPLPKSWYLQSLLQLQARKKRFPRLMQLLMNLNLKLGGKKPKLDSKLAHVLARWYEPHNRNLETLTGLDLSHWHSPISKKTDVKD